MEDNGDNAGNQDRDGYGKRSFSSRCHHNRFHRRTQPCPTIIYIPFDPRGQPCLLDTIHPIGAMPYIHDKPIISLVISAIYKKRQIRDSCRNFLLDRL